MIFFRMLLEIIPIHPIYHPHLMQTVLSVLSKLNLLPNRPHSPLPPPKLRSLRWMQFNLPLHNNLEVRKRQKINQKILITMNNQKIKLKHLLLKSSHNGNWNSCVSFVVTITTLDTVHIAMKWPNSLKGILNLPCWLNLFHRSNIWFLKPPLQGAVPAILLMIKPQQVPISISSKGSI